MSIDWSAFTPWQSLAGGGLLGLAASLLVLGNGRIAGISGVLGDLVVGAESGQAWRVCFLIGLLASPWIWFAVHPGGARLSTFAPASPWEWAVLGGAGLLVGFGTRLANGCTSGHGVCGLARLSLRSLAAVLTFMGSAAIVVFIVRHGAGA